MYNDKKISVVIPCYNEEAGLHEIFPAMPDFVDEVIIIDNGCSDNSIKIANGRGARVIFEKRKGYGFAIKAGLVEAKGDIIVIIDADNSYPVRDIEKLLGYMLSQQKDFVIGCRYPLIYKGSQPVIHIIANYFITLFISFLFHINLKDSQSGMVVFKKEVINMLQVKNNDMGFSQEFKIRVLSEPALNYGEMHIAFLLRKGQAKFNRAKDSFLNLWALFPLWLEFRMSSRKRCIP